MYPEDEAAYLQVGKDYGLRDNLSGIIRFIFYDWQRFKARENGSPAAETATGEPATVRAAGKRVATAADSPLASSEAT